MKAAMPSASSRSNSGSPLASRDVIGSHRDDMLIARGQRLLRR